MHISISVFLHRYVLVYNSSFRKNTGCSIWIDAFKNKQLCCFLGVRNSKLRHFERIFYIFKGSPFLYPAQLTKNFGIKRLRIRVLTTKALFRNKRFMLNEKLQQNALNFAILLEYENPSSFRIPKVWQTLKRFSGAFRRAQTSYF